MSLSLTRSGPLHATQDSFFKGEKGDEDIPNIAQGELSEELQIFSHAFIANRQHVMRKFHGPCESRCGL